MGHKVNPAIFRIGISVDWKYQLRDPLLANIFIYKLIKNLVFRYSVPYTSYMVRRTITAQDLTALQEAKQLRSTEHLSDKDITDLFVNKNNMILNPFLENSFVFSHLNISYAPSLFLAIFLLDGEAEKKRLSEKLPESSFYYLSGKFFKTSRQHYSYFLKGIFQEKSMLKETLPMAHYNYFYLRNFIQARLRVNLRKARRSVFFKKITLKKKAYFIMYEFRRAYYEKREKKLFPIWLINIFSYSYHNTILFDIFKNLKILKFLLRYLKMYNKIISKKRLFFFNILIVSVLSLLTLLPKNSLSRKLFIFLNLCYLYLFSFRYMHLQYNKNIFQSRFFLFNFLSKFVLFSLKKVAFLPTDNKLILRYYGLHNRNLNAHFILNYILVKLSQYFLINDILRPLTRRLKSLSFLVGYRLVICGRLTRKERAAFIVKSYRQMPLSTYKYKVDYAADFKIMKFGVVGIKIYLLTDGNFPYYYFFEFKQTLHEKIS